MSRRCRPTGIGLAAGIGLLAALWPASAAAQDWRTVTATRNHAGEDRLAVRVEYGAGRFVVTPAPEGTLYRSRLRYDADVFRPATSYRNGRLRLGFEGVGRISLRKHRAGELDLALGPGVPLDLDFDFGAVQAELELGGLMLRRVELSTGASETTLRFSKPNPMRASRLSMEVGAAAFRAYGLGNANAERVSLTGGVGDIVLDFSGEWHADMSANIEVGLGSLTLHLPRGIGVRVLRETVLASFDAAGLVRRGDGYYSEDWDAAPHKLTVRIGAALGSINIRWIESGLAI